MKSGVASRIYVKLIKLSFHIIIRVYVYSSVILRSELYVLWYVVAGMLFDEQRCIKSWVYCCVMKSAF